MELKGINVVFFVHARSHTRVQTYQKTLAHSDHVEGLMRCMEQIVEEECGKEAKKVIHPLIR